MCDCVPSPALLQITKIDTSGRADFGDAQCDYEQDDAWIICDYDLFLILSMFLRSSIICICPWKNDYTSFKKFSMECPKAESPDH